MSTTPPRYQHTNWKNLYRAAILETNNQLVPQRLWEAEAAVVARGREIFYEDATAEEKETLEDALYALRAYRTACDAARGAL